MYIRGKGTASRFRRVLYLPFVLQFFLFLFFPFFLSFFYCPILGPLVSIDSQTKERKAKIESGPYMQKKYNSDAILSIYSCLVRTVILLHAHALDL